MRDTDSLSECRAMSENKTKVCFKDIVIVGAGAAGLLFAGALGEAGGRAVVIEGSGKAGTKLLMAGGGQCNLTHGGSAKDFIVHYGDSGRYIRGILQKYNNVRFCRFMESLGVPVMEREDGKIFPASMNGRDVLNALLHRIRQNGTDIISGAKVTGIRRIQGGGYPAEGDRRYDYALTTEKGIFACRYLVIATGGCSYPSTGSDGKMLEILARDLAIKITPLSPALAPVYVKDYAFGDLSGMSFKNVRLTIPAGEKTASGGDPEPGPAVGREFSAFGDLLFAERKLSGPVILDNARRMAAGGRFRIGFLGRTTGTECAARMKRDFPGSGRSPQSYMSEELGLPRRFSQRIAEMLGISGNKVSQLSGAQINRLAGTLTDHEFVIQRLGGFEEAMATCGGVALEQIKPQNMSLPAEPGLYVIGEAVDIDGDTGGYNLQFAFSSANAAAADILRTIDESCI